MKKNKVILSLFSLSIVVSGANAWSIGGKNILQEHPVQEEFRAIENGGTLPAIDAATDGIGTLVVAGDDIFSIDNSAFNNVVYTFGKPAKNENISLVDYLEAVKQTDNVGSINQKDIEDITIVKNDAINSGVFADGVSCNDNNPNTENDVYTDGVCIGEWIDGTVCNDQDPNTENDVYTDGVCKGTLLSGTFVNLARITLPSSAYCGGRFSKWTGRGWSVGHYTRQTRSMGNMTGLEENSVGYVCYAYQEQRARGYSYHFAFDFDVPDDIVCDEGTKVSNRVYTSGFYYKGQKYYQYAYITTCAVCDNPDTHFKSGVGCVTN